MASAPCEVALSFSRRTARWGPLAALILVLAVTAAVRYRYLGVSLERDEGEFAYGGQLLLAGEPPYVAFHAMKLPGIYLAYAGIEVLFGQTVEAIHLGLLLVNLATIVVVYGLGSVLIDRWSGVAAALAYSVAAFAPSVEGTQAQAEHFVLLPALFGLLLLLWADRCDRLLLYAASGLALGLALLVKQHGASFALGAVLYVLVSERKRFRLQPGRVAAKLASLLGTAAIPLGVTCLVMAAVDAFGPFVFWTFTYAREYATGVAPAEAWQTLSRELPRQFDYLAGLWLAGALGLVAVFSFRELRQASLFLTILLIASAIGASIGGYFRIHYFLFVYPPLALLSAAAARALVDLFGRYTGLGLSTAALLMGVAVGWPMVETARRYADRNFEQISQDLFGASAFPASAAIANYLAENSSLDDTIAVMGSEPQLFFLAKRRSATPHIYMFPLMEPHPYALRMQREAIDQIEAARPKFIVMVKDGFSWNVVKESHRDLFDWLDPYLKAHYYLDARVDCFDHEPTHYVWDSAGLNIPPRSQRYLLIWRRWDEPP